jgi:hypothetical protein
MAVIYVIGLRGVEDFPVGEQNLRALSKELHRIGLVRERG